MSRPNNSVIRLNSSGALSLYVAITFVVFLLMAGVIADGATLRSARRQLDDTASQIARAAAQKIDFQIWHGQNELLLNADEAESTATSLMQQLNLEGEVEATADGVEIRLAQSVSLRLIPDTEISATRQASPVAGLT